MSKTNGRYTKEEIENYLSALTLRERMTPLQARMGPYEVGLLMDLAELERMAALESPE